MVQFIPRFTNIDYLHAMDGIISYQHAALTAQSSTNEIKFRNIFDDVWPIE